MCLLGRPHATLSHGIDFCHRKRTPLRDAVEKEIVDRLARQLGQALLELLRAEQTTREQRTDQGSTMLTLVLQRGA